MTRTHNENKGLLSFHITTNHESRDINYSSVVRNVASFEFFLKRKRKTEPELQNLRRVKKTEPRPFSDQIGGGYARFEVWLAVALRPTRPSEARVNALVNALGNVGITRPLYLTTASDDILTNCGFQENEKNAIRNIVRSTSRKTAVLRPNGETLCRLAEFVIVSSSVRIVQIGLKWETESGQIEEQRFPDEVFCGEIMTRRLTLAPGDYIIGLKARYEVLHEAVRSLNSAQVAPMFRLIQLSVTTKKKKKRSWVAGAVSGRISGNEQRFGRKPLPNVVIKDMAPNEYCALVGLELCGATDTGATHAVSAFGGLWAAKASGDLPPQSSTTVSLYQPPPSFRLLNSNPYTGDRMRAGADDPWLSRGLRPLPVTAIPRENNDATILTIPSADHSFPCVTAEQQSLPIHTGPYPDCIPTSPVHATPIHHTLARISNQWPVASFFFTNHPALATTRPVSAFSIDDDTVNHQAILSAPTSAE